MGRWHKYCETMRLRGFRQYRRTIGSWVVTGWAKPSLYRPVPEFLLQAGRSFEWI